MYDSVPKKYLINSLKRDFGGPENESVTFTFDTYNDQKNAFNFGITPYNVQREVLISEGGTSTWGGGGRKFHGLVGLTVLGILGGNHLLKSMKNFG